MRNVLAYTFYPVVLFGGVALGALGLAAGWTPAPVVIAVTLLTAGLTAWAQAVLPYEASWRAPAQEWSVDTVNLTVTGLVGDGSRVAILGLMVGLSASAAGRGGLAVWPTSWPLGVQLALALIVGDLGAYWVHRIAHSVPLVWRLHAVHHTATRLYVLASGRNHPMNVALTYAFQVGPLLLLGADAEVLALVGVFTSVNGLLQHTNADLRHGVFNWVFATADLHRWHHHPDRVTSQHNFGSNLMVWDDVFGTRWLPVGERPTQVGLPDLAVPINVLHHLVSPFVLARYRTGALGKRERSGGRVVVGGDGQGLP